MQELWDLISKTYGLAGILILLPVVACWILWKENQRLHAASTTREQDNAKVLAEAANRVISMQEQRVNDVRVVADKLIEMNKEQAALVKENNLSLDEVSKLLREVSIKTLNKR